MNITEADLIRAAAPRSDQINADDLMSGPKVVTIDDVRRGSSEQPIEIVTREFGPDRPYRPGKSMIRVLITAWGKEASTYKGRRLMLYRDPDITFGREKVGGIRISAMSHLDKKLVLALTVTRGKRAPYVVEPLAEQPAPDYESAQNRVAETTDLDELRAIYADMKADGTDQAKQVMAAVMARKDALQPDPPDEVA
ncbi:hypothetical protein [Williamsia serinedens]|uniref:Uncharacterized protein n=1 Tax=Williamsia serinedens TaxID=391736 RepID=A0ABT1H918_9NOCA|nr:hypothetical protein [Williamsia serinedens]MCP2163113.1 hypothetical protein [Williamsia serinedens]